MLPCADVHLKILPAISRELAAGMEQEKLPRSKIAAALGTSDAAISQYLSGKRGMGYLSAKAADACRKLAKRIADGKVGKKEMDLEISKILVVARGSRLGKNDPCAICMSH